MKMNDGSQDGPLKWREPCPKCGELDCDAKRAAFAREPFLGPCFMLGSQWYSFDNGTTWTNNPDARKRELDSQRTGTMTVIAINRDRGELTVKVLP